MILTLYFIIETAVKKVQNQGNQLGNIVEEPLKKVKHLVLSFIYLFNFLFHHR